MLGIIPTLGVGGIFATLGLFFPALFGGMMVLLRRWRALLTVISTISLIYFTYLWFQRDLLNYRWGQPKALLMLITFISLIGALWAWARQDKPVAVDAQEADRIDESTPRPAQSQSAERWTLWVVSLLGGLGLGSLAIWTAFSWQDVSWKLLLILTVGTVGGSFHVLWRRAVHQSAPSRGLPTEGVVLWGMVLCCVALMGIDSFRGGAQAQPRSKGQALVDVDDPVSKGGNVSSNGSDKRPKDGFLEPKEVWQFVPAAPGEISSTPLIRGRYAFIGINEGFAFQGRRGVMYCLDLSKKPDSAEAVKWKFDAGGQLKQMFSSPQLANGRLYFGEGFHTDGACKLYCIDAETGYQVWTFPTSSHTESTPFIADGRVFFGAGDDGIYCADAKTGKLLWQYPSGNAKGLHVDAAPTVVGNRLYCSSGMSRLFQRFAVFCLDVKTGKEIWIRDDLKLPAWGSPTVKGDHVYVGMGNGRLTISDPEPEGAVLCLDARDGKRIWKFDRMKDAVHCRPVVDEQFTYVVSRDAHCYALDRYSGRLRWKRLVGAPAVARPALASCTSCGRSNSLYVASTAGHVHCLSPTTGEILWVDDDLTQFAPQLVAGLNVVVTPARNGDRRRLFLATPVNDGTQVVVKCIEDHWKREAAAD